MTATLTTQTLWLWGATLDSQNLLSFDSDSQAFQTAASSCVRALQTAIKHQLAYCSLSLSAWPLFHATHPDRHNASGNRGTGCASTLRVSALVQTSICMPCCLPCQPGLHWSVPTVVSCAVYGLPSQHLVATCLLAPFLQARSTEKLVGEAANLLVSLLPVGRPSKAVHRADNHLSVLDYAPPDCAGFGTGAQSCQTTTLLFIQLGTSFTQGSKRLGFCTASRLNFIQRLGAVLRALKACCGLDNRKKDGGFPALLASLCQYLVRHTVIYQTHSPLAACASGQA